MYIKNTSVSLNFYLKSDANKVTIYPASVDSCISTVSQSHWLTSTLDNMAPNEKCVIILM